MISCFKAAARKWTRKNIYQRLNESCIIKIKKKKIVQENN